MDNKNSCFLALNDKILPDLPTHINTSISLEGCFVIRLHNIYLLFSNIWSPWRVFVSIFIYREADKTGKIVFYLISFVWVLSGRFLSYLHEINNIKKRKRKLYRGYCPPANRWPLTLRFYPLLILKDYFY